MLRVPQITGTATPTASSGSTDLVGTSPGASTAPERGSTFVVKLRDALTRSWGNEHEVIAASPREAAEQVAGGEHLLEGPGERADLRARVWMMPYGSTPDLSFYTDATAHSS
jgi:hypothetical protein